MNERRKHRRGAKNIYNTIKPVAPNPYEDRVSRMIEEAKSRVLIERMVNRYIP